MPRTFTARYPGTCPECHESIEPGGEVMYSADNQVIHVECDASLPESMPTALICPRCNLQQPCGCENSRPVSNLAAFAARAAAKATTQAPAGRTSGGFFEDQVAPRPAYKTLEDEVEDQVKRDTYGRPLIEQPDGSTKPYSRASSYGGQLDDKTNVEKWSKRQVVRGVAIALRGGKAPAFLDSIPERLFDPWEDQDGTKGDKKMLDSLVERAQDMAGSNLKSQLGTDIHYATELIDLGESLADGLKDFEPERRSILMERADAYYKKTTEMGLKWDSVETFGVQDDLEVAGTWDRRGWVPWWPEHQQVIGDVKTSSTMDFAGITYAVQLATYAHMKAYDLQTHERTPHEDMNEKWALIVHVERFKGGLVELYPVNIDWGWRHARLAREVIMARREGGKKGKDAVIARLDEREALIRSMTTRADLEEQLPTIFTFPDWLQNLARDRWNVLA